MPSREKLLQVLNQFESITSRNIKWNPEILLSDRREMFEQAEKEFKTLREIIQSDANWIDLVRSFLATRWHRIIKQPNANYLAFPQFPMNQACIVIAGYIANRNERILPILIPIKRPVQFSEEDLWLLKNTEEWGVDDRYLKDITVFTLNEDGTVLGHPSITKGFYLTNTREQCRSESQVVKNFIERIYSSHAERKRQFCEMQKQFMEELEALRKALAIKPSKDADEDVFKAVKKFYQFYMNLDEDARKKIRLLSYKPYDTKFPLEFYINLLFASTVGCEISEKMWEEICKNNIPDYQRCQTLKFIEDCTRKSDYFLSELYDAPDFFLNAELGKKIATQVHPLKYRIYLEAFVNKFPSLLNNPYDKNVIDFVNQFSSVNRMLLLTTLFHFKVIKESDIKQKIKVVYLGKDFSLLKNIDPFLAFLGADWVLENIINLGCNHFRTKYAKNIQKAQNFHILLQITDDPGLQQEYFLKFGNNIIKGLIPHLDNPLLPVAKEIYKQICQSLAVPKREDKVFMQKM